MKLKISREVMAALREKQPLVALETAVITHGLPAPLNLETGMAMEAAVRAAGAVPCTVGVLQGAAILGLSAREMEELVRQKPVKLGLRDLPAALALGQSGGTTVAATAYLARRFGIKVFATGGIGGVHRGATATFDISGDLQVLAHTPITVVAAGAKAILDLKLTLEYLETMGIPLLGYRTSHFPAFYAPDSPYPLPARVETAAEAAQAALMRDELGLAAALLVCNPVPAASGIPYVELMEAVETVSREITGRKVAGKEVTPAMLKRLAEITGGRTLAANQALLIENARLAAEIALELYKQKSESTVNAK
ncbi:MAG: pseudouridine-5'-phosphate glycosidase [Firmicutes bacterium]|nr:pseudouridine-5'-phosphate glycosidase [Bacillota bacterium]